MEFYAIAMPDAGQRSRWMPLNPMEQPWVTTLPTVSCKICGQTWTNFDRFPALQFPADSEIPALLETLRCVDPGTFRELTDRVRKELKLGHETPLRPGATFGPTTVSFRRTVNLPDFIWDWPGQLFISPRAQATLRAHGLSGYATYPIRATIPDGEEPGEAPLFVEIVFTGNAGPAMTNPEFRVTFECDECGFQKIGRLKTAAVDASAWDGSDLCRFSGRPRQPLVTARTRALIEQAQLTNIAFWKLEDFYPGI